LSELTPAKLREWASRPDVTPKRLANGLLPLRSVLSDAVADDIIDRMFWTVGARNRGQAARQLGHTDWGMVRKTYVRWISISIRGRAESRSCWTPSSRPKVMGHVY